SRARRGSSFPGSYSREYHPHPGARPRSPAQSGSALTCRANSSIAIFGAFCPVYTLSITGRVTFSAATHFGVGCPACQVGAWASSVRRTGSVVMRGSECALRTADTWPALSVHSATWSVIQRMWVHAASRRARSTAFGFGNVYWWGIVHTIGCLY